MTDQADGQQPPTDQPVDPETPPAVTPAPATSGWGR
jgi:hypothetical protein